MKKTLFFYLCILCWLVVPNLGYGQIANVACNSDNGTPWVNGADFSGMTTQTDGILGIDMSNPNRAIDNDLGNYAERNFLTVGWVHLEVRDDNSYPAGTWAGFRFSSSSLGNIGTITITALNGSSTVQSQTFNASSILDLGGTSLAGFYVTNGQFNRLRIRIDVAGATIFRVYNAVLNKDCVFPVEFPCNEEVTFTKTNFPMEIVSSRTGFSGITGGSFSGQRNVIDSNTGNSATIFAPAGLFGSAAISVRDRLTDYSGGQYVGVQYSNFDITGLTFFDAIRVETYLNGSLQETITGDNLFATIPTLGGTGVQEIGFQTEDPFDEVRFVMSINGVSLGTTNIYNFIIKEFCEGEELQCNVNNPINSPEHPVFINGERTGITGAGCASCQVLNADDLIEGNGTATIQLNASAGVSGAISVKNGYDYWQPNTFVGFDISEDAIIDASIISAFGVELYKDGALVQEAAGATLWDSGSIIGSGDNRRIVGVLAGPTVEYDEARLVVTNGAGLSLGSITVNDFIIKPFCIIDELECNTLTHLTNPGYPVYIGAKTGITTLACSDCEVSNAENVINADESDFATIQLGLSVGSTVVIEVGDALNVYPAGYYAGFDISNDNFLNLDFVSGIDVEFYMDNTLVTQTHGDGSFASTNLTGTGRTIIGTVATGDFNRVLFRLRNVAGLDFGDTKVYGVVIQKADEECAHAPLECGEEYVLTAPEFNMVINADNTGFGGVICSECNLYGPWNVIDNDPNNYADINVTVGTGAASLSVLNLTDTYPAGTIAGFYIQDVNGLLESSWFESITITTYLDGVQQEQSSVGNIWEWNFLVPWWGSNQNRPVGFQTSLPYDEIQISYSALTNALSYLRVIAPFVSLATAPQCSATISGNVFLDTNNSGVQNGTEPGTNLDDTLYVYLVNEDGIIVGKSEVDENGNYSLTATNGDTYTVHLSAQDYDLGTDTNTTPIDHTLPNEYVNTGENQDGTVDGTADGVFTVTVPAEDVDEINVNFGVNAPLDSDGDGIPDSRDIDSDNDGIPDVVEGRYDAGGPRDTDGDGIPDYLDLDSDNDGILDINEGRTSDQPDLDLDNDGRIDDNSDADGDGLADGFDVNPSTPDNPTTYQEGLDVTHSNVPDTDGDGKPDFQDVDSDNDGISDLVEGGSDPALDADNDGMIDNPVDADGDGVADDFDVNQGGIPSNEPDTDGDGAPDYRDLDSDNDSINDVDESGIPNADADGDGMVDVPGTVTSDVPDTDNDGTPDYLDIDSDGDGIPDLTDPSPYGPGTTPPQSQDPYAPDADGDGVVDGSDSDGDGILDPVDGDPDNFGDLPICRPDLTPSLAINPAQVIGNNQAQQARIVVSEILGCNTNGSDIYVMLPQSTHYVLQPYDSSKTTSVGGLPVLNSDWEYTGMFDDIHYWHYIGNGGIMNGYDITAFGIDLIYNANSAAGNEFLTATIVYGSGGEVNTENNFDTEEVRYGYNN